MSRMLEVIDGRQYEGEERLPALASAILEAWESALVVHLADLPLTSAPLEYFDRLVEAIGTPHDLGEDARIDDRSQQRVGRRWMEVRYDPAVPNAYRHSAAGQPLHTDGSYIPSFPAATLMFCLSAATAGGETIFLDRADLLDVLEREAPSLLDRLRDTPVLHRRSGDERRLPVIRESGGETLLNWNYFCVDGEVSPAVRGLSEEFLAFLSDEKLVGERCQGVRLQPGEAVVWKDDRVLHGRRPFTAHEVSERFIWKCAVDVNVWE